MEEAILMKKYGLPVANADNVLKIVKSSGVADWKKVANSAVVENCPEFNLFCREVEVKRRYKIEISQFLSPNGEVFNFFRLAGGCGTRVFTLLDGGLVPICAEFQHGCGEVLFDLPGGRLEIGEDPAVCARREFEEESGIILEKIIPLGSVGMPIAARHFDARNFSFIGIASNPVESQLQKLDPDEYLKVVLVNLDDWLKLIEREVVQSYSVSTTLLALRRLQGMGMLKRNYYA